MELSVFLAKLIGLYCLIVAILCAFRKRQIETTAKELVGSRSALAISGGINLLFGLVIVIDHSTWEPNWRGLITLLGYLMVIKGIMRYAFPGRVKKIAGQIMENSYWVIVIVTFIIGLYLTYSGFTAGSATP